MQLPAQPFYANRWVQPPLTVIDALNSYLDCPT